MTTIGTLMAAALAAAAPAAPPPPPVPVPQERRDALDPPAPDPAAPAADPDTPRPGESAEAYARRRERSDRFYMALWMVEPEEAPLGRRTIAENDYVVRGRLLPPGLVRLAADAVDAERGRPLLAAGTQLFALSTGSVPIWCELRRRRPGNRLLSLRPGPRQLCLVDMDKDGRADASFETMSPVGGVPNFSGYRPADPTPLTAPVAIETLRPEEMEERYFVGLRYEGLSMSGARPVFSISFGSERKRESLTERVTPRDGVVTALGAEFTVAPREGRTLDVDIRRNLERRPFVVMQTVTYR